MEGLRRQRLAAEAETRAIVEAERARVEPIRRAFEADYGLRPFRSDSPRHLLALLGGSGAGEAEVREVLMGCFGVDGGGVDQLFGPESPFDHIELWGRGRTPLILVGHPYQIDVEAHETLDAVRSLGLMVKVLDPSYSWYGFGSLQVVVYPAAALAARCPDRPTYPWPA